MEDKSKLGFVATIDEIVIDFGQICRFCLSETDSDISVFDKCLVDEENLLDQDTICNFVSRLTCIKMNDFQNFPSLVCKNCHDLIKVCYNFCQICQKSDLSLRDCYQRTLNETKTQLHCKDLEESKNNTVPISVNVEQEKQYQKTLSENVGSIYSNPLVSMGETILSDKCASQDNHTGTCLEPNSELIKRCNIGGNYAVKDVVSPLKKSTGGGLALSDNVPTSGEKALSSNISFKLNSDKVSYSCTQCSLKFDTSDDLNDHYLVTHEKAKKVKSSFKYHCKVCLKKFLEKEKLVKHYKLIHNQTEVTESDLNFARKSFKSKIKFYCCHCIPHKVFTTSEKFTKHLDESHNQNHLSPTLHSCGHCNSKPFSSRLTVIEHLKLFHNLEGDETTEEKSSERMSEESNLNTLNVFVCTDCSPPFLFANMDACVKHKIALHDKQLQNIPLNEFSPVCLESPSGLSDDDEHEAKSTFKVFCRNCNPPVGFTSACMFVCHMNSNHKDSRFRNWDIESKRPLESVNEPKKEMQKWKCQECPAIYFRRQSFYHHMKEKHKKLVNLGSMKCPDCDRSFYTNRQVIQHGISVHKKYFAYYHKVFKSKILRSGNEVDDKIKNFECDICQKKYLGKNSLRRHLLKAHLGKNDTETVDCPHCGKMLSNKLNLKSHIEFVHEALFVSCPICKKQINFKTLGKHYKTHQSPDEVKKVTQFLCNLCGKFLKSKKGFDDHQKLHKEVRDHLCDICGTGFTTKKFLQLHKKTHEGAERKMFECHQCDKVFSGRHTLNRHLLTHSGKKNYICEMCSKRFYTLQELNRHVRSHKKEYRFDCQLCEMRFLDKSRFRHHMMRHRNVRPHKCQFCDKMFIVRRKMNLHMAAKHNVEIKTTKKVWKDPKTYVPLDDLL